MCFPKRAFTRDPWAQKTWFPFGAQGLIGTSNKGVPYRVYHIYYVIIPIQYIIKQIPFSCSGITEIYSNIQYSRFVIQYVQASGIKHYAYFLYYC